MEQKLVPLSSIFLKINNNNHGQYRRNSAEGLSLLFIEIREKNTDIILTRLFLRRTNVLRGEKAAEIFYDQEKFSRKGATPKCFQKTLFGVGGVQGLDGEAHVQRKALFMDCMDSGSVERLKTLFKQSWEHALIEWEQNGSVVLFNESEKMLTRAVCKWTGTPVSEGKYEFLSKQLSAMIDGSGAVGLRHYRGKQARKRAEKWIGGLIRQSRDHRIEVPENSIFSAFCFYTGLNGEFPGERIMAVEILNLLRPVVAIARYIAFMAVALHTHPETAEKVKDDPGSYPLWFIQEVRRYFPFFPFVAARVKKAFKWNGVSFPGGRRVLLDLYATTMMNTYGMIRTNLIRNGTGTKT